MSLQLLPSSLLYLIGDYLDLVSLVQVTRLNREFYRRLGSYLEQRKEGVSWKADFWIRHETRHVLRAIVYPDLGLVLNYNQGPGFSSRRIYERQTLDLERQPKLWRKRKHCYLEIKTRFKQIKVVALTTTFPSTSRTRQIAGVVYPKLDDAIPCY